MYMPYTEDYKLSPIFPSPQEENYLEEKYTLKEKYDTEDLYTFYLACKDGTEDITLNIDASKEKEEYAIDITEKGICITASNDEGFYRAFSSLRQLIHENDCIPFAHIKDNPDIKRRAYMLDICGVTNPRLHELKKLVDHLSAMKYNEFTLCMHGFSAYKYPEFLKYNEGIDCLDCNDIMELDKYCKERFIELFPTINCFGHMADWLREEEFSHLKVGTGRAGGTLNPILDESLELLDKIFNSVLPYFSSNTVDIQFDEAFGLVQLGLDKTPSEIALEWLHKVCDLIKTKYKKDRIIMGHDMFMDQPELYQKLPKDIILEVWGYSQTSTHLMEKQCKDCIDNGVKHIYMTPSTCSYGAVIPRTELAKHNIRVHAEIAKEYKTEGVYLTEWNDWANAPYLAWTYLPTAFCAQMICNGGPYQSLHASYLKAEFWYGAERYVDKFVFKAPVSRILSHMGNYYMLENERIPAQSIVKSILQLPLSVRKYPPFYDIDLIGETFCFEHVIDHLTKLVEKLNTIQMDETVKKQMLVNVKSLILGAEYGIVKVNNSVTAEKAEELSKLTDWIIETHKEVLPQDYFVFRIKDTIKPLEARRTELFEMIK